MYYIMIRKQCLVLSRPSGTEPKIKLYMGVKADSMESAEKDLEDLKDAMVRLVK